MKRTSLRWFVLAALVALVTLACALPFGTKKVKTPAPAAEIQKTMQPVLTIAAQEEPLIPTLKASLQAAMPTTKVTKASGDALPAGVVRQWAADAEASSEYEDEDWSASQATGAPNVNECDDSTSAWASYEVDTVDWINLFYKVPVTPVEIRVYQSYNPGYVVKVELIDMQGKYVTVYTGEAEASDDCPYMMVVPVTQKVLSQGVRVTVDQTDLEDWCEIDAVELIGTPGQGTPVRPKN